MKCRLGWTLGKFMPFHIGHISLIERAIEESDFFVILLCGHPSEPMPIEVREEMISNWISESLLVQRPEERGKIYLYTYFGNAPQSPSHLKDDPEMEEVFWDIWEKICSYRLLKVESRLKNSGYKEIQRVLWTGDDYGPDLGVVTNSEWQTLDRRLIEESGTKIREDFIQNWHSIHPSSQRALKEWVNKVVWDDWNTPDSIEDARAMKGKVF
jgi:cytidyltransferase-like protein